MELSTRSGEDGVDQSVVETVEVVAGGGGGGGGGGGTEQRVLSPGGTETTLRIISPGQLTIPSSGIIEIDPQALSTLVTPNFDVSTVTSLSLATNPVTTLSGTALQENQASRTKRTHDEMMRDTVTPEIPRKKSRNYLDSHKSIEKKRRDRINNGLTTLKDLVPNCRQYSSQGSKKLDKAEVLEMTIEYIQRLQQNQAPNSRDIEASQRDLINDLMSWIFQNKLLYTGPSGVEQFSNALLLHLQSLNSTPSVSTAAAGLMYNQYSADGGGVSTSEDEQHTLANTNNVLLQQLASATANTSEAAEESNEELSEKETSETQAPPPAQPTGGVSATVTQQQTQLAQLQALLLLQQQHLYQGTGGGGGAGGGGGEGAPGTTVDAQQIQQLQQLHQLQTLLLQHLTNEKQAASLQEVGGDSTAPSQSVMVSTSAMEGAHGSVGLSLTSELESTGAVYATDESLVVGGASNEGSSQMWSQTSNTVHQESPLLMENEGGVQEEVELLEQGKANF